MGYCIFQGDTKFRIKAANKAAALEAVRALAKDEGRMSGGAYSSSGRTSHFSWVTTDDFALAKTLEVALEAWRWPAVVDEKTGDIVGIEHRGEKRGDDPVLWDAIAPFVESGSYIQMSGEDGNIWRWCFDNGRFDKRTPTW
jgi:hypothetical protein